MTNALRKPDLNTIGRVLLVEDEATNMLVLSTFLRNAGYSVDEVEDGQAAWDVLQRDKEYDLIITDRIMPRMDGLSLSRNIKMNSSLRMIPIIMQTAATSQEEISEGINGGVYYYLTKPYEEQTLIAITHAALRDSKKSSQFEEKLSRQRDALGRFVRGEFHIQYHDEAENIAFLLGSLFPRPEIAVSGLYELLVNSIEHGNLGIGYEEKRRLSGRVGDWEQEIKRRQSSPENVNKKTIVQFAHTPTQIMVTIMDEGAGFDWRPFMEIEPSRATQATGRGIAKANMISFDRVLYSGKGNQVQVICNLN